jgi:outer membrane protein, heavy metal efflux system
MTVVRSAVVAIVVVAAGRPLEAEPPPTGGEEPALAALVQEALARNPDLLAAQEAATAARARPDQARSLPDPMLSLVYTNDGWAPSLGEQSMTTLGFMGSQVLPWPGKRGLRGDIASKDADAVAEEIARVRLGLTAAVERAYWSLVLAQDLLALVSEQEEIWKEIEGVARARYAVGQGALQDVLRVQVELTRVEQLRTEQQAEGEVRRAELARLVARSPEAPIEIAGPLTLRQEPRSPEELLTLAEQTSPELRAAAAAIDRDRLAVGLAEKEFRPDFTVQAGYMNRGGLDPMWQAGVGVNLPIHRKRLESGLAEAQARARASEQRRESIRLELQFRTRERLAQLKTAEAIARLYADGIIPQARMSVEAAIANYQAGKVPFISVLEALSTLYGDRSTHLRTLAAHERIRASLAEASLEATSEMPTGGGAGSPMGLRSSGRNESGKGGAMAAGSMGQ